jgi:ATP-binding cassette subfamily B protein
VVTAVAITLLDARSAPLALVASACALLVPLAWQPALIERDMRIRTHTGALARWYLDALLGLMPVRTHGATATAVVAWMLVAYASRAPDTSGVLLLAYWSLYMALLGEEIALVLRQYPLHRNVTLRTLEPLGAIEEADAGAGEKSQARRGGAAIEMENVSVIAAGHTILEDLSMRIEAGEQVAIVGVSGAGKSSFAGLLLGWHRAATGRILVDGEPLEGARIDELRAQTAWIDPAVHIWNRSLLDNLRYGADASANRLLARVLEVADVQPLLDRLPDGMQTSLGEGGALVSGGEGQRVRLARAMMRPSARLAILDEPFRGLDRGRRRELLSRARAWWKEATLLCITHDVAETLEFDRVLVVDRGRIVEDGAPRALLADTESRYAAMHRAERALFESLWGGPGWHRVRLERGRLVEEEQRLRKKELA